MSGRWGISERDREKNREVAARLRNDQSKQAEDEARASAEAKTAAAAAAAAAAARPLVVQLDGLVLLKMINHSKESMPDVVSGQLLGLDVGSKLEVTNCFPFPAGLSEEHSDQFQADMMKQLRQVNVDNNTVGWYQSAYLGTFFDQGLLEAQYTYQKHIPNSVVVVYDPFQTSKGRLVLKAFRLSDDFMKSYTPASINAVGSDGRTKFNYDEFNRLGLDSSDIFQPVPIKVHNSHLVHGFLYELREEKAAAKTTQQVDKEWASNMERLALNYANFVDKNINTLGATIENYSIEQGRFQAFLRAQQRQKQQQNDYLKRRVAENDTRVAAGKDPLPEEDLSKNPLFKPLVKPNRLETYLLSNQISYYCESVSNVAEQTMQKLYLIEAMQKKANDEQKQAIQTAASGDTQ